SEAIIADGLLRHVQSYGQQWTEEYRWDAQGRLARIDGVEVQRDRQQRVTACVGPHGRWDYGYAEEDLVVVDGPHGFRHITRDDAGRPVSVREGNYATEICYDSTGCRVAVPPPPVNWTVDTVGRLWTVRATDGTIRATYLWDGLACIGRIDGAPGEPLAAVFSLDPSCTPVRVITRAAVVRIPRDAFGEGLLAYPKVPGLYGGAAHKGFFYLRARRLDPATGAFDRPDPWHGRADDPRRMQGYSGPLRVDNPAAGPYAVCQNDPIGRADPTGEISWWLIPSTLTWSFHHNLGGWLGMYAVINFWGTLFQGFAGQNVGRFFSLEGLAGEHVGSFGVRVGGVLTGAPGNAWTYQHMVMSESTTFQQVEFARVLNPRGPFRPTCYGTLLRLSPDDGAPFLLRGALQPGNIPAGSLAPSWSRAGGIAEPVIPGSLVPHFPTGGIHFDAVQQNLLTPQGCQIVEVEPSENLFQGTIEQRAVLVAPATGLGLSPNALVLLTDAATGILITRVVSVNEVGGTTRIRLESAASGIGPTQVRLRGLSASLSSEQLTAIPTPGRLSTAGTTAAYNPGDPLRLTQGGVQVGSALIQQLESVVLLEAPLPASLTGRLDIRLAAPGTQSGTATIGTDSQVLGFAPGAAMPSEGTVINVTNGTTSLPVVVIPPSGAVERRVDRSLASLGAAGTTVTWQALTAGMPLGHRDDAPEAAAVVTYQPDVVRTAPSSGVLIVQDQNNVRVARRVTGAATDAIVIGAALPGTTANPYTVERFTLQAPDQQNLTVAVDQAFALDRPLPDDVVALQLHQVIGTTITAGPVAGMPVVTVTGTVGSVNQTANSPFTSPTPTQFVVLSQGTTNAAALVTEVRLTVTLDRTITVSDSGLEAVLLQAGSPAYRALQRPGVAPEVIITVLPEVAGTTVQMPRLQVGELVETTWTDPAPGGTRRYRVTAVSGTTLTLTGDAALPATTNDLTVTRLVVTDPLTGSSRLGLRGEAVGGTPTVDGKVSTSQMRFQVWQANDFRQGRRVGIIDGDIVHAIQIPNASAQILDIEFAAAPTLTGAGVTVTNPPLGTVGYSLSFTRDGTVVTLQDAVPPLPAPGTNLLVAIAFRQIDGPDGRATGELSAGTVRVPEEVDNVELTRRQSLTDHELTHTLQCASLGAWLLGFFPLGLFELGVTELWAQADLPEFSAYVSGTLSDSDTGVRILTIPDSQGIAFAADNLVQIAQNGVVKSVKLGAQRVSNEFVLNTRAERELVAAGMVNGPVQVRREESGAVEWAEWIPNILQISTVGGLLNLLSIGTYGGLIFLILKLYHGIRRLAADDFPATVGGDGLTLTLGDTAPATALQGASNVVIKSGDTTMIRAVAEVNGRVVRLASATTLRDNLRVSPYSLSSPGVLSDWHDYFPATVPDRDRPAAIRIAAVNGQSLTLSVNDRVTVTTGARSRHTSVTAVAGDGTVELEDAVLVDLNSTDLLIAKVGEDDPVGSLDQRILNDVLELGWLQYIHDPYGQIQYRAQPQRGSVGDVFARAARYLFGSQSWSILPAFGYVFWDNFFKRPAGNPHLSSMEQEASHRSGDTYSPVGLLRGDMTVVGDIARYWHIPTGGGRNTDTMVQQTRQDAPGVHLLDFPRVMPFVLRPTPTPAAGTQEPNLGAQSDAAIADPGRALPDIFVGKNLTAGANWNAPSFTNPRSFAAADRGWIPTSPTLERTSGVYVAFTQPSTTTGSTATQHRVTVTNSSQGVNLLQAQQGREADEEGLATLVYDLPVADVTVTVAGRALAEGDTFTFVPTQRARVQVTPNANRRYTVTLTRPNDLMQFEDNFDLIARTGTGEERAEVSRFYRLIEDRQYETGGIQQHGVHLPTDIHIPVRSFRIVVDDQIELRTGPNATAGIQAVWRPGETGFLTVPANLLAPWAVTQVTYTTPAPGATDPNPAMSVEPTPTELTEFLRDGRITRVTFAADDPPEEAVDIDFGVSVGTPTNSAILSARVRLEAHFRLTRVDPGTDFQVAPGVQIVLRCSDSVNAGTVTVAPPDGITVATAGTDVTLTIAAGAALGARRVFVVDAAEPTHQAKRTIQVV
ncbi:MAG: hypothetical protein AB7G75_27410, partial [Candidatus Binatia bacterium]